MEAETDSLSGGGSIYCLFIRWLKWALMVLNVLLQPPHDIYIYSEYWYNPQQNLIHAISI